MLRRGIVSVTLGAMVLLTGTCLLSSPSSAETIESALARAYQYNPQLDAQRAATRVTDENVPQALSGYRPKVGVTATIGEQNTTYVQQSQIPADSNNIAGNPNGPTPAQTLNSTITGTVTPYSLGISGSQTLFNGFQTANRVRAAESQVSGANEALRVMVQTILLNAATIYMDVLRDTANLQIQQSNVRALRDTLAQTRERFSVADVTRTDVSQAEAQLAAAGISLLTAEVTLQTSKANYFSIIGAEPKDLTPGAPVERFVPPTLPAAIDAAMVRNPNVTAATFGIDVAHLQVKIAEGALYPTLAIQATAQLSSEQQLLLPSQESTSVVAQLSIPLYQGGSEYSLIRQSKETLGQQRLNLDLTRNQTRVAVTQAWAQVNAAKGQIQKAQAQVAASERALNGMREEVRFGQRTTFDVLNAEQVLVNARVSLIVAQHDRVVASYNLLAAVGGLSPQTLGISVPIYDPQVHYHQVRDSWEGVRTPDGR